MSLFYFLSSLVIIAKVYIFMPKFGYLKVAIDSLFFFFGLLHALSRLSQLHLLNLVVNEYVVCGIDNSSTSALIHSSSKKVSEYYPMRIKFTKQLRIQFLFKL